jgi:hypothetical protein
MFQFQGGISDGDKERMFFELQKRGHIVVAENGSVQYPPTMGSLRGLLLMLVRKLQLPILLHR